MKLFMVIWKDGDGIPRVWGQAANEEQADARAADELKAYRRKRPELDGWTCIIKEIQYDADGNPLVLSERERV